MLGLACDLLGESYRKKIANLSMKETHRKNVSQRICIGRTGIIAGAVLLKTGKTAKEAFALISDARGVRVPDTEEQENWLGSTWVR